MLASPNLSFPPRLDFISMSSSSYQNPTIKLPTCPSSPVSPDSLSHNNNNNNNTISNSVTTNSVAPQLSSSPFDRKFPVFQSPAQTPTADHSPQLSSDPEMNHHQQQQQQQFKEYGYISTNTVKPEHQVQIQQQQQQQQQQQHQQQQSLESQHFIPKRFSPPASNIANISIYTEPSNPLPPINHNYQAPSPLTPSSSIASSQQNLPVYNTFIPQPYGPNSGISNQQNYSQSYSLPSPQQQLQQQQQQHHHHHQQPQQAMQTTMPTPNYNQHFIPYSAIPQQLPPHQGHQVPMILPHHNPQQLPLTPVTSIPTASYGLPPSAASQITLQQHNQSLMTNFPGKLGPNQMAHNAIHSSTHGSTSNNPAKLSKKHVCDYCGKRFTRPSSLQTHRYSHTGEKPFECEFAGCGKKFSVISNLRRHMKIHGVQKQTSSSINQQQSQQQQHQQPQQQQQQQPSQQNQIQPLLHHNSQIQASYQSSMQAPMQAIPQYQLQPHNPHQNPQ